MVVLYMLQYLDKTTLGYAAIIGIEADTVIIHQHAVNNCGSPNTASCRSGLLLGFEFVLLRISVRQSNKCNRFCEIAAGKDYRCLNVSFQSFNNCGTLVIRIAYCGRLSLHAMEPLIALPRLELSASFSEYLRQQSARVSVL